MESSPVDDGDIESNQQPVSQPMEQNNTEQPKTSGSNSLVVILVVVVVLLIAAAGGYFYLKSTEINPLGSTQTSQKSTTSDITQDFSSISIDTTDSDFTDVDKDLQTL